VWGFFFFWGGGDQKFRQIAEANQLNLTLIPGAGHNAHLENPTYFAEKIENIEEVDGVYAYIDGSFDRINGIYGSGVVIVDGDKKHEYKHAGNREDYAQLHNVAGEIEAAKKEMEEQKKQYGPLKKAPIQGKEEIIQFLKEYRDSLHDQVEQWKASL